MRRKSFSKSSLRKAIRESGIGESVYINAINLSPAAIEELRNMIKIGLLVPDYAEVVKAYKIPEHVMCGDVIVPQMSYTKGR